MCRGKGPAFLLARFIWDVNNVDEDRRTDAPLSGQQTGCKNAKWAIAILTKEKFP